MDDVFREKQQNINIFFSKETVKDPYTKDVTHTVLNSIPIKAIVDDVDMIKLQYIMPGRVYKRVKQIIIKKKYESMLKLSYKIKIGNDYYEGFKIDGNIQYKIEDNYLRCYVTLKVV